MTGEIRSVEEQLIMHEGLRLKPHLCTVGKLSIGVGRNFEDQGISEDEAMYMLWNDMEFITARLEQFVWWRRLDPIRQKVVIDMAFNQGIEGFLKCKRMISALERGDYQAAACEMANSAWYRQVGRRGKRLERTMRTEEDYTD